MELRRLRPELEAFLDRYAPLFGRPEAQGHARRFVHGLLLGGDRRSVENIAEAVDGCVVRSLQPFIVTAPWDAAAVLAAVRDQVAAEWGDPDAVLTVDETGLPKKGTRSVGVKRQYSGTLGRTENCQVGVFVGYHAAKGHTEGRVTFLNPTAQVFTGWDQREAAGRPLEEVFPIINEGTRQPVENPVARVIREGVVVGLANHTVLVAKDGTERPIEDSAAPIKADDGGIIGVILVFHDVSERQRAARALEERTAELTVAKAHLEAVFDSVGEGIAVFDQDANIVFCNAAEARMCGYASPAEMLRSLSYFAEVFELSDAAGRVVPVDRCPVSRVLRGEAFTD